jgi:hypothetical protein
MLALAQVNFAEIMPAHQGDEVPDRLHVEGAGAVFLVRHLITCLCF